MDYLSIFDQVTMGCLLGPGGLHSRYLSGEDLPGSIAELEAELGLSRLGGLEVKRIETREAKSLRLNPMLTAMGVTELRIVDALVECDGQSAQFLFTVAKMDTNWRIESFVQTAPSP